MKRAAIIGLIVFAVCAPAQAAPAIVLTQHQARVAARGVLRVSVAPLTNRALADGKVHLGSCRIHARTGVCSARVTGDVLRCHVRVWVRVTDREGDVIGWSDQLTCKPV